MIVIDVAAQVIGQESVVMGLQVEDLVVEEVVSEANSAMDELDKISATSVTDQDILQESVKWSRSVVINVTS